MKIKVEFDLTPKEFRESLGLPEISGLQDQAIAAFQSRMGTELKDIDVPSMVEKWFSQGLATSQQLQELLKSAMTGARDRDKSGDDD